MTTWHPATKLLLLAALLAVPYLLWTREEDASPPVAASVARPGAQPEADAAPAAEMPAETPSAFVLPPLERFTAVVERPLFSPTRRLPEPTFAVEEEPPPEMSAPAPAGPEEPALRFFGTVRQGNQAAALVTDPETAEVTRLLPGDMVGAWTVLEVARNRLVPGLDGEQRSFEIFGAASRAAAPPPPGPFDAGDGEGAPPGEEPLPE